MSTQHWRCRLHCFLARGVRAGLLHPVKPFLECTLLRVASVWERAAPAGSMWLLGWSVQAVSSCPLWSQGQIGPGPS